MMTKPPKKAFPCRRLFSVVAAGAVLALTPVAGALAAPSSPPGGKVAVATRPANVPADYIATPDGFFAPSCVYRLAANQLLVPNRGTEAIVTMSAAQRRLANPGMGAHAAPSSTGVVDTVTPQQISAAPHVSACTHNHYSPAGTALSPQTTTQSRPKRPTINGWLEDAQDATTGPMSSLHEEWNVPRGPKKPGRQYVYFFPGFQNLEGPATIMQPVLAWTGSGNINGWYASSWNCCIVGNVYGSDNILITGTTVTGDVSGQGCAPSTGVCSSWTITVTDQRSKKSATLTTTSGGYPMNWTFGGVLEPYGVSRCSHFPGTDLTFSNTSFTNIANEPVSPTWETEIHTPVSPQCGYKVTFPSPDSITLSY